MKKIFFLLLLMTWISTAMISQKSGSIHVEILGLRNANGTVQISLYNKADGFPQDKEKIFIKKNVKVASNKTAGLTFTDLTPGYYAVAIHHDENSNGEMEYNWIGMPKEGYGFSRNFVPSLRAPKFHETNFKVEAGDKRSIKIKVIY